MSVSDQLPVLSAVLRRGHVRWFVGAGMSMEAGLPSGDELAREIESEFGLPHTGLGLADAAQSAYDRGLQGEVRSFVAERMRGATPTAAHKALGGLRPQRVYTTNYDCLLEKVLAPDEYLVWAKDSDLVRPCAADHSGLYKLHGCIDRAPEHMVIASSDYQNRLLGPALMEAALKADAPGHNFIFVGYGLGDPYLKQLFQQIAAALGALQRRSWIVDPGLGRDDGRWLRDLNIQPIPLSAEEFFEQLQPHAPSYAGVELTRRAPLTHEAAAPTPRPHLRRDRFVNREEELRHLVLASEQHQGVVITGQARIGKRQLALALLSDACRPQDEDAWLEAVEGPAGLAQIEAFKLSVTEAALTLPITPEPPARLFAVVCTPSREAAVHALAALTEVSDVTAGQVFWLLLAPELSCTVPNDVDVLPLGELAPEDAAAVVTTLAPGITDRATGTLAEIIGGIPGLLADAARIAAREGISDHEDAERVAHEVLRTSGPEIVERIVGADARDELARLALLHLPFHRLTAERVLRTDRADQLLSALLDAELLIEDDEGRYGVPERLRLMLSGLSSGDRDEVAQLLLEPPTYDARWPIEALLLFADACDGEAVLTWLREWGPVMSDWGFPQVIAPVARALSETPPDWFAAASDDAVQWALYLAIRAETESRRWGDVQELHRLQSEVASPSVLHGLVTNMLGIWRHNQRQLHRAADLFGAAISEFSELGEVTLREQTEHNLALVLADQGRRTEAREMLHAVYESAVESGRADSGGTALGMVGKLEAEDGDLDDAIPHLREAVRLLGRYGSVGASGTLRYDLGVAYFDRGDWAESERWLRSALAVMSPVPNSQWFGQSVVLLTSVLIKRRGIGETEEALMEIRKCLVRLERDEYHVFAVLQAAHLALEEQAPGLARELIERAAETAIAQGDPAVCANVLREAVRLLIASGMDVGFDRVMAAIGVIARGEAEPAIRLALDTMALLVEHGQHLWLRHLARRAARVAGGTDDRSLRAQTMGSIGAIFRDAEDIHRARAWFRKALAVYEKIGSTGAQAVALHEIGNTFAETHQWRRAMRHYYDALDLAASADDREIQLNIRMCVAELERRRGAPERAINEGLSIIEALPDSEPERKAFAAHNLSLAYLDQGEPQEAAEWNQRSYDWAEEAEDIAGMVNALRSMAIRKLDEGDPTAAIAVQEQVREMAREAGLLEEEMLALQAIAEIAAVARVDDLLSLSLQEALDLATGRGNWRVASEVATQAAAAFAEDGQWRESGGLFMHGLIFSVIAGVSTEQRQAWQRSLLQVMAGASPVAFFDEFEEGATAVLRDYADNELGGMVHELRSVLANIVGTMHGVHTQ